MQYAYRAIIVFVLFLEFKEILWDPSIPREDSYILALFRSDPSTQSYSP
jgi:hypothetical protein